MKKRVIIIICLVTQSMYARSDQLQQIKQKLKSGSDQLKQLVQPISQKLKSGSNQLTRLFHHKAFGTHPVSLEQGNLVLYFDREPTIQSVTKKHSSQEEKRIIFLPSIQVSNHELKAMIEGINKSQGPYKLEIKEVAKPVQGLQVVITFNPEKLGINFEKFESIGRKKALVFRFYNKELLEKIELISNPIITTACRSSVVIDCGHGGKDPGTVGCNNICEKDVCLPVGLELARVLQAKGIDAHLARDADTTVLLDARTTFANGRRADLFVSIHANSAANRSTSGIETYFIEPDLFSLIEGDKRLYSCLNKKYEKSKKLAHCVHNTLVHCMRNDYNINDRLVRSAASNVLIGTIMPSVLVEIGFVSHATESQLLSNASYQKQVAQGIAHGILDYLKQNSV